MGLYRDLAARAPDAFRPDLPISLRASADRCDEADDGTAAIATNREALQLTREMFGPQHPNTVRSTSNLATLHRSQGLHGVTP